MLLGGDSMELDKQQALFDSLVLELRRGTLVLCVMSQLKTVQYGYSLVVLLEKKGVAVDAGTLYPLLRRLESQGILESSWAVETSKPRKYYKLTDDGEAIYKKLCEYWASIVETMNNLIGGEDVE
mgnify:CR=1 FL=1